MELLAPGLLCWWPSYANGVLRSRGGDSRMGGGGAMRVGLVQGSATRLGRPAPARAFYTSALFRLATAYAAATYAAWAILSSRHGLLRPEEIVEADEGTLAGRSGPERALWARGVATRLWADYGLGTEFYIHAGAAYYEPLARAIGRKWVYVPVRGLRVDEQRDWYAAQASGSGDGSM